MKPLVYYCRWQGARLRLYGRDEQAVWGELVLSAEDGSRVRKAFRYLLDSADLYLDMDESVQHLRLDDMGVPIPENG